MSNIVSILSAIQAELKAPKNQLNKFGGYNYRSCEDILEALKPITSKMGAAVTINDDIILVGTRFYIKATATLHFEGESISNSAFAREPETKKGMDESQITGTASSYARKYALNGLFAIDDTKDADTMDNRENAPTKASKADSPKPTNNTAPTVETAPAPIKMDELTALSMMVEYGEHSGYPLKVLADSNPKMLNDVYTDAKAKNDARMLAALSIVKTYLARK